MKPSKIDVPVLLIFFARPATFRQVFESVREARPSVLLLWQDGPRKDNEKDRKGIEACRQIVESGLDWECTVYKTYNESNYGCDPSTFYAHKWAFSLVDKCIILEDDMVPSQSYYPFCKELLDKYEADERINHICGVNPIVANDACPDDYFFSYNGTGAWASWRRVAKEWDEDYTFLEDAYSLKNLAASRGKLFDESLAVARERKKTGKPYWETILGFGAMLHNRLVIIPKVNLVKNIGFSEGATHGSDIRLLYPEMQKVFLQDAQEMAFPLKHPAYMVPDQAYLKKYYRLIGFGHPVLKAIRKIDYLLRCVRYGGLSSLIKRKFGK